MQYIKLARISYEIQKASNASEVYDIWLRNSDVVRGCTLIYASTDFVGPVVPVNSWKIMSEKDYFPRGLFNSPNLFILNDEIVAQMKTGKTAVKADLTVILDSNVVNDIVQFVNNRKLENPSVIDFLIREGINFNYDFFALENARRFFMKPRHALHVYEKVYCLKYFDYLDTNRYLTTNEKNPIIELKSLTKISEQAIQQIFLEKSRKSYIKSYLRLHYLIYSAILKIVHLEFSYQHKAVEKKIELLLEFMSFGLNRIFRRELYLGFAYFNDRKSVPFMQKINNGCADPLDKISNIAWDMMMFRVIERTATSCSERGQVIPYFISYDLAACNLSDSHPIKGLIVYGENNYITILDLETERRFIEFIENAPNGVVLAKLLNDVERRHEEAVIRGNDSPKRKITRELENQVVQLLKTKQKH